MIFASRRHAMVEHQLRRRGIRDVRVLDAMLAIPREEFIPANVREYAYDDEPIGIGSGQTISQPYMTALMSQLLELKGNEAVLEVGAGCGYHAAVLGRLASRVVTVERIPALVEVARRNLADMANVTVIAGDGALGYPPAAPYDAISVAAASEEVPAALLTQLAEGGRIVMPVGPPADQELRVGIKQDGLLKWHVAAYCRFVPLV